MTSPSESGLPPEVAAGATLSGNEYAWSVDTFSVALSKAAGHGLACLGGQFQFQLQEGICEMYWLEANSKERVPEETWADYCHRSCAEVKNGFDQLIRKTDFSVEISNWPFLNSKRQKGVDLMSKLVFVAYFITEREWRSLTPR